MNVKSNISDHVDHHFKMMKAREKNLSNPKMFGFQNLSNKV